MGNYKQAAIVYTKYGMMERLVKEERSRRDNYNAMLQGKGGQQVGDSHSPRWPPSVLLEFERILKWEPAE